MTADEKRFWSKVNCTGNASDCWLWTARSKQSGYGSFKVKRRMKRAHRFAWEITNGPIPEGLMVCHSCNAKACCNPTHLYLGTMQDNTRHAIRDGLFPKTMTREQRIEIRRLYASGMRQCDISRKLGIHSTNVNLLIHGKIFQWDEAS